jgi:uncharacterized protein (DUF58 family)
MSESLWQRFRDALAGGMRQRVTVAGLAFTLGAVLIGTAAFLTANNLLFLLLAAMLSIMLVSGFVSRLSLAGLELSFALPDHLSARRKIAARMRLRNEKGWMPSYSIHVSGTKNSVFSTPVYFPVLPGGATVEVTVDVEFARRGRHREDSFRIWSKFPFGFAERQAQVSRPFEVLVYPCLTPHPFSEQLLARLHGEIEARTRGRGLDFYRIRPYEALESARHVDWKATAHTGELQVREFAAEEDPLVEIALDLHVEEEQREWFERAVECAAFLCWQLSLRGGRIWFRTQEFERLLPTEADIYTILKYLAEVTPKLRGKRDARRKYPFAPGNEDSLQVVFTTSSPEGLEEAGWHPFCVVGPDLLSSRGSAPDAGAPQGTGTRP